MAAIPEPERVALPTPVAMPSYGRSSLANAYQDLIKSVHQPGGANAWLFRTMSIPSEPSQTSGERLDADPSLCTDDHEHHWTFTSLNNTFDCTCGLRLAIATILRLLRRGLIAEKDVYSTLGDDLLTRCYVLAKITDEPTVTTTAAANASTFWNEYRRKY